MGKGKKEKRVHRNKYERFSKADTPSPSSQHNSSPSQEYIPSFRRSRGVVTVKEMGPEELSAQTHGCWGYGINVILGSVFEQEECWQVYARKVNKGTYRIRVTGRDEKEFQGTETQVMSYVHNSALGKARRLGHEVRDTTTLANRLK